jgi:CHASE2 domain-containing sensor protein
MRALLWGTRILCLAMFLFAAPFFVGYGVPDLARLPWYDLVQLALITAALLGLIMAWRWEITAGLVLTGSGVLSSLVGVIAGFDPYSPLLFCLAPGLLLLAYAMFQKRLLRREA